MGDKSLERKLWYVWTVAVCVSILSLFMPVFEIRYSGIAYTSPDVYTGYGILFDSSVTNFLHANFIGRSRIEFLTLKVLLCVQLLFDVMLILVWASSCWPEKIERIFYVITRRIYVVVYPLILIEIQRCSERYVSSYKGSLLGGIVFWTGGHGWIRWFHVVFILCVMVLSVLSLVVIVKSKACSNTKQ